MTSRTPVRELLERARGGDSAAFAELSSLYSRRLEALSASLLTSRLRRRLPVEDVVQETFARALESIGRFAWRGEESFLRWLGTIARNVIARSARGERVAQDLELARDALTGGPSPSRAARREERFDRLQNALCELARARRMAVCNVQEIMALW